MSVAPLLAEPAEVRHVVIAASAGSGKTFQLVSRYVQLLASGVPPSNILASTFTRLAAGEIRDRVLRDLASAVHDPKASAQLAQRLGQKSISPKQATVLLTNFAKHLHQARISTLDSFFAGIVRTFAIELGLPPGAQVIDEAQDRQVRGEAIRLMLDERDPQLLVDLLRRLSADRAERAVHASIDKVVSHLHALYQETERAAWECVPALPGRLTHAHVEDAIARLEQCVIPAARKALHTAHLKDAERARTRKWEELIAKGIAGCIAIGESTYRRTTIDDHIIDAYRPIVDHARAVVVQRVRERTLAMHDLLALFDERYRAVKHASSAITFADLTMAMANAQRLGTLDDICFRIDASLRHVLLDEFQDTSIVQWRALEPLVLEIISTAPPERSFFCVGDVKQSIYAWRNAAPEVLEQLPNLLRGTDGSSAIATETLALSRRSSPVIINAVNSVFESIAANPALRVCPEAAQLWVRGFERHDTAKKDSPGCVELRMMPAMEGDAAGRMRERCRAAAELVNQLHRRNPTMSIAVLARSNKVVARVLNELGPNNRNIPASGRGGGPVTDAAAVNAVLDLLRLADHPGDTIAAFNIVHSPAGVMVGLTDHADDRLRSRVSRAVRRQLLDEGYGPTITAWTARLAPSCDDRELRRLVQLTNLAGQHDARRGLRTRDFLDMVEYSGVSDAHPAPVQVMTIHQAKGLEFDAVILPELDADLNRTNLTCAFERHGEIGPITRICASMNEDVRALVPELQPLFDRQRVRTVRESLSVLYVAMTRARHGLYMIIDAPKSNERNIPSTFAGVLRSALGDGGAPDVDGVLHRDGDPEWMINVDGGERSSMAAPSIRHPIRLAPPRNECTRGLAARPASSPADPPFARAMFLTIANDETRLQGIAIHALMEQVEWLEDFRLDDAALAHIVRFKVHRRNELWAMMQVRTFRSMCDGDAIRQMLARPPGTPADMVDVHRELPFARIVDGRVQQGSIDRLVVRRNENSTIVSAEVIDFKTDAIAAADVAVRAAEHSPQLKAYRAVVSQWLEVPEDCVSMTVVYSTVGRAVRLT